MKGENEDAVCSCWDLFTNIPMSMKKIKIVRSQTHTRWKIYTKDTKKHVKPQWHTQTHLYKYIYTVCLYARICLYVYVLICIFVLVYESKKYAKINYKVTTAWHRNTTVINPTNIYAITQVYKIAHMQRHAHTDW